MRPILYKVAISIFGGFFLTTLHAQQVYDCSLKVSRRGPCRREREEGFLRQGPLRETLMGLQILIFLKIALGSCSIHENAPAM